MNVETIKATITEINPTPGSLLWIRLGGEMDDGMPPYLPTTEEIYQLADEFECVLQRMKADVQVLVTHYLVDATLITSMINPTTWPPKKKHG